ncbi:MAG: DNA methyltransferase [Methanothrix sp.]
MQNSNTKFKGNNELRVVDFSKANNILKNINWNFSQKVSSSSNKLTPFNCRKYHWFPSTFIPEIPFTLIEVLTLPGAVVYDPFSGIGTTYFQALILNRLPLAIENNSVAVTYMRDLFALFNPQINYDKLKDDISVSFCDFNPDYDYILNHSQEKTISNLNPWFSKRTMNTIAYIMSKASQIHDEFAKAAIRIAISSMLKNVSSQDRGWGCIADNVLPRQDQIKDKDVLKFFKKNINILLNDILLCIKKLDATFSANYDLLKTNTIIKGDVRDNDEIEEKSIDLVVTSPPYPNMTDYVTSQRLSYYYLDLDLKEDLHSEIGARIKRFRRNALEQYLKDMIVANKNIAEKLKKGGYACYIMPLFNKDNQNNIERRDVIQKILTDLANYGLVEEAQFQRIVPAKRRSQNIKWATLEREKILVLRKE